MLNDKSAPDLENKLLADGVALLEECNAHIRPGQAAKLQQAVLLKVSALCTAITNGTLLCGSADIHRVVVLLGRAEDAYGQKIESIVHAVDTLQEAATVDLAAERLSKFMEDCATLQKAITASTSCFGLSKVLLSNLFTKPAVDPIGKASIAYPAVTECLDACFLTLANSEENAEDLALDTKATGCISDLLDVTSNLVATLADDVALVFSEKREPFVEMKASYDTLVLFFQLGPSAEARLQRDPQMSVISTVPAATNKILSVFSGGELRQMPSWLQIVVRRVQAEFTSVGFVVAKLKTAKTTRATDNLCKVNKLIVGRPKGAKAEWHYLDAYQPEDPDEFNADEFVEFIKEMLFTVNRDPLDAALEEAKEMKASIEHFAGLFGKFPDDSVPHNLDAAITTALVTKCENELFGTYVEHCEKPAHLKRMMLQIRSDESELVWNSIHPLCESIFIVATQAPAKKTKVD